MVISQLDQTYCWARRTKISIMTSNFWAKRDLALHLHQPYCNVKETSMAFVIRHYISICIFI